MSCKYCEDKENLIDKEFNLLPWYFKEGYMVDSKDLNRMADTFAVFIDRGYLRLADVDDCNCIESGEKIKINFCPNCGEKIK